MEATHFILIYSVLCENVGTRLVRKDYCETGVREIKYLEKVSRCSPEENVAVFKIKFHKHAV
jgi:hypothetical protein